MNLNVINLASDKAIYFASDFHLGSPNFEESRTREHKIIAWLEAIKPDAQVVMLVGDLFDFWYEYKKVVPKGFVRFLGKLAELRDLGITIYVFNGNHDLWMKDYFETELSIPVFKQPTTFEITQNGQSQQILVGHGDGLGPGDYGYKFLKKIFTNPFCIWAFGALHPDLGIWLATRWSDSRKTNDNQERTKVFYGNDKELIYQYCVATESTQHHDYYIFGHRHLEMTLPLSQNSQYINLGEWITGANYVKYQNKDAKLLKFAF